MAEVLANADIVHAGIKDTAEEYGVPISGALIAPWDAAKDKAIEFKNTASDSVSSLINEDGIITLFGSEETKSKITSVFGVGTSASVAFKQAVESNVSAIKTLVENSTSDLTSNLEYPWNDATKEDGPIATFSKTAGDAISGAINTAKTKANDMKTNLTSPWDTSAINTWSQEVEKALKKAQQDAVEAGFEINKSLKITTPSYIGTGSDIGDKGDSDSVGGGSTPSKSDPNVKKLQQVLNIIFKSGLIDDGIWGKKTERALRVAQLTMRQVLKDAGIGVTGKYDDTTRKAMVRYIRHLRANAKGMDTNVYSDAARKVPVAFHSKGTIGTKHDEFAITDESWIGEEITLAAGKNGQLQYLKKGSAVMPADISANLVEWGKLNPNMMGLPNTTQGINFMSSYVNKPELNLSFEALVKAGSITQETLPFVKKLVTEELDKFTRKLNYAIKRA
jgi:hypothetical protein